MERLIISSYLECNYETCNKNKGETLADKLASFAPVIICAIYNIRHIKCKRPHVDAIYWCFSKTIATNVDRGFIETIVEELESVSKHI